MKSELDHNRPLPKTRRHRRRIYQIHTKTGGLLFLPPPSAAATDTSLTRKRRTGIHRLGRVSFAQRFRPVIFCKGIVEKKRFPKRPGKSTMVL